MIKIQIEWNSGVSIVAKGACAFILGIVML